MLLIIVALYEEAKFIIQSYKLKEIQNKKFRIFENENIALIISGVGEINAAIATTYLSSMFMDDIKAFFNIGIAGHLNLSIGQMVLIHEIFQNSQKRHFLSNLIKMNLISKPLITVGKPQDEYDLDFVYDMEAKGFFLAASKFTYIDLIYCLKIISDNKSSNVKEISKSIIEKLMIQNFENIKDFINKLIILKSHIKPKIIKLSSFFNHMHLTYSEQHYVKDLVWKIKALKNDFELSNFFKNCKDKKQVFKTLEDLYMDSKMIL